MRLFRQIKAARNESQALAVLASEFPIEDVSLSPKAAYADALYRSLLALAKHADPVKVGLSRRDLFTAIAVFLLVSTTSLPAILPLLLINNADLALRASNLFLILLLFMTGYAWANFSDARPFRTGITMTCLGLILVGIAVALGG